METETLDETKSLEEIEKKKKKKSRKNKNDKISFETNLMSQKCQKDYK